MRRRKLGQASDTTLLKSWTIDPPGEGSPRSPARRKIRVGPDRHADKQHRQSQGLSADTAVDETTSSDCDKSLSENESEYSPSWAATSDIDDDSLPSIIPNRGALPAPHSARSSKKIQAPTVHQGATRQDTAITVRVNTFVSGMGSPITSLQLRKQLDADESLEPTRPATPHRKSPKYGPKGLLSPKKLPRIPPMQNLNTDTFWSQEFVDDWNETHVSPKKLFDPEVRTSPAKPGRTTKSSTTAAEKDARRTFERLKHQMADDFLGELDERITAGKLAELAASGGGITIRWTNKLNTTAGRANWRRETVRARPEGAMSGDGDAATHDRHYASIELAEKVIDDEQRLLNVIAHEFCHLANFMISGVTARPHGKEFKAWATKCSAVFGARGVQVSTKHTYDIDYKYVWACTSCALEYKRHSKSIDTGRHRCGACKGELKQTKPVPRGPGKPSAYQVFVKEQMKALKEQNPKSPQKDIMKLIASEWSRQPKPQAGSSATLSGSADRLPQDFAALRIQDDPK